ncbi:MAG: pyridoxal phosphate-dependent aminotransferase [Gemmatimonadaceae bacterium]
MNVARIRESATMAVAARARSLRAAGQDIIDLGAGEPDFATPAFICRAAEAAIAAGATHYTAVGGITELREAISEHANRLVTDEMPVDPADVVVSCGSKQSLFNACFTLFGEGDGVLVPTPGWTSYYDMVALARATPVPVFADRANGLKVTRDELEEAATGQTRGLILNSPCNPTGAVYSHDELGAILDLAGERDWWVLSDEIYARITYDEPAPSALEFAGTRDRLVVCNGVAKAYAMTGWRIGWAIAPRDVARAMTALQSHTTSNAASVSQHAALAALTDEDAANAAIGSMVASFRERRDAALAVVRDEGGLHVVEPEGAFYLFIDVAGYRRGTRTADTGSAFAESLLAEQCVAVVPGAAFLAPNWIRVSYAAPMGQVLEGVRRVVATYCAGS